MNTAAQYQKKRADSLYDRVVFGTMLLNRTMDVAAAFAFDCGRLGLEGAGAAHIEMLEGTKEPEEPAP